MGGPGPLVEIAKDVARATFFASAIEPLPNAVFEVVSRALSESG